MRINLKIKVIMLFVIGMIPLFTCTRLMVFASNKFSDELLKKFSDSIILYVGSPDAYSKAKSIRIDSSNSKVVPLIVDGRTLVPVRFISENLGAEVAWNNERKTIY